MNPWFKIPSHLETEKRIAESVREILSEGRRISLSSQLRAAVLKPVDRIRFLILHRQFSSKGVIGLPTAVWAARKIAAKWEKWNQ